MPKDPEVPQRKGDDIRHYGQHSLYDVPSGADQRGRGEEGLRKGDARTPSMYVVDLMSCVGSLGI